jgi:hypothetical protein
MLFYTGALFAAASDMATELQCAVLLSKNVDWILQPVTDKEQNFVLASEANSQHFTFYAGHTAYSCPLPDVPGDACYRYGNSADVINSNLTGGSKSYAISCTRVDKLPQLKCNEMSGADLEAANKSLLNTLNVEFSSINKTYLSRLALYDQDPSKPGNSVDRKQALSHIASTYSSLVKEKNACWNVSALKGQLQTQQSLWQFPNYASPTSAVPIQAQQAGSK